MGQPDRQLTAEDYAYSRLLSWAAYCWPEYRIGKHHAQIAEALQAVERGEITRLIITVPPRHGKSMLASEYFPAWYLGRNPDQYVIAASYAQELAEDFGRKVRNIMAGPEHRAVFGAEAALAADSQSTKRLATVKGGSYYAVGVGGPITGRGAHLLLIDDPIKSREDADSEVSRRKIKDWYTSTAYTRLMPGGRIVVIQTRWHEDDLTGWLLSEHQREGWEVLNLPAITNGEALWPEQYNVDALARIRASIGPRDWSALYMQEPTPESGDYFLREWIRHYTDRPKELTIYGASDYAVTADGGDYTVHGVMGVDQYDNIYLLDWWRGQTDTARWIDELQRLIDKWEPVEWAEESGVILKSVGPYITKRLAETGTYCYRKPYTSTTDKAARAQSIRGRLSQGKVFFPKMDWADDLVSEMLKFPAGKNDDQVDVLSLFGRIQTLAATESVSETQQQHAAGGWMG